MGKRLGSHGANSWTVPGGKLEFGESFEDCSKREVMEETGLTIDNVKLIAVTNNIFPDEGVHSITIWMESDWESGEPHETEPDKFVDFRWHTFKDLPEPLFLPWVELKKAKPELFR